VLAENFGHGRGGGALFLGYAPFVSNMLISQNLALQAAGLEDGTLQGISLVGSTFDHNGYQDFYTVESEPEGPNSGRPFVPGVGENTVLAAEERALLLEELGLGHLAPALLAGEESAPMGYWEQVAFASTQPFSEAVDCSTEARYYDGLFSGPPGSGSGGCPGDMRVWLETEGSPFMAWSAQGHWSGNDYQIPLANPYMKPVPGATGDFYGVFSGRDPGRALGQVGTQCLDDPKGVSSMLRMPPAGQGSWERGQLHQQGAWWLNVPVGEAPVSAHLIYLEAGDTLELQIETEGFIPQAALWGPVAALRAPSLEEPGAGCPWDGARVKGRAAGPNLTLSYVVEESGYHTLLIGAQEEPGRPAFGAYGLWVGHL